MKDISMKVNPLYLEVDLSIAFQFEFEQGGNKVGEALVSIYPTNEKNISIRKGKHISVAKQTKVAVIDHFDVIGEVEEVCMKKLKYFLSVIGISDVQAGYKINRGFGK
ncbi:hypothetical protein [Rossellomorea aquimaris]|uniref:hypothetical protein n=1 Tax=Rossellomorea aquimaris TaxID=189382 RepID=UPI0007D08E76|nr:hypothetical protein [Rossellomorea aquimaris]